MRGLIILCLAALVSTNKLDNAYLPIEHYSEGRSFTQGIQGSKQNDDGLLDQPFEMPLQYDSNLEISAPEPAVYSAEFRKEFYSFSASENGLDDHEINNHIANSLKKSLRVVFIKAPENQGFEKAALNLAKQASQERTAIYVLSKQADVGALAQQFQNLKSQTQSKPEVHFVKYRTSQDAVDAKQRIQEQYNTLPGASKNVNGGQASVLNFASRAPVSAGHIPAGPGHQYLPANPISMPDYLPPSLRRFRL